MNFDNNDAYILAIEYMRRNHMKSSKHLDYYRLFLEAYMAFNNFLNDIDIDGVNDRELAKDAQID